MRTVHCDVCKEEIPPPELNNELRRFEMEISFDVIHTGRGPSNTDVREGVTLAFRVESKREVRSTNPPDICRKCIIAKFKLAAERYAE